MKKITTKDFDFNLTIVSMKKRVIANVNINLDEYSFVMSLKDVE